MMTRARWVALCALLGGGCLFPSLSSLTDGGTDATSDVLTSDIASPETGPTDASADADANAPPGPFCIGQDSGTMLFCDDFDDTDAATFAKWTSTSSGVTRDPDASTSLPFSLLAVTPPSLDASAPNPSARLRKVFTKSLTHVTYTFDARIDQLDSLGSKAFLNMVTITSGGIDVQYRFAVTATALTYDVHIPSGQDVASLTTSFLLMPWSAGAWHHVVIDIFASTSPATITVAIDGTPAVGPNAPAAVATFGTGQSMEVQAGFYYANTPESGWAAHVDNVLVQSQ